MPLTTPQQALLCHCFLFRELPVEAVLPLFQGLNPQSFAAGEAIYTAQQFQKSMGILLAGEAAVQKDSGLVLNLLGPGQCFGVAALFHPVESYVTTVRAKSPVTLVFLSDQWLTQLFAQYPQAAVSYIAFLSERIQFLNEKIDSFTAPTTLEGVYRHLMTVQADGVARVPQGYSQLARQLNMGRASLYRSLDVLEARGLIAREGRKIRLIPQSTTEF